MPQLIEKPPKAMNVREENSRLVRPSFAVDATAAAAIHVPLTVFDKVTYNTHIAVIYAFRPPNPPNSSIAAGLAVALSEYRDLAGRLAGTSSIALTDEGARLVEASVDSPLDEFMPLAPSPESTRRLHPRLDGRAPPEELALVQLTRFSCGSLAVGFAAHHLVADGHAMSRFLMVWGRAVRGLAVDPLPLRRDRFAFAPRDPPSYEYEHRGAEYQLSRGKKKCGDRHCWSPPGSATAAAAGGDDGDEVVFHKVHFSEDDLTKLKSTSSGVPYSTFECMVAHLWRAVTAARGLDGAVTTKVRISVNGRTRMVPRVPSEYFGNLVLWAFPAAMASELTSSRPEFAAGIIRGEVTKVASDEYFRSFIDFSGAADEVLVPTADMKKVALWPDMDVDSWLRFPFWEVNFGGGEPPYCFVPAYIPMEGLVFILPELAGGGGGGGVDAFVAVFRRNLAAFKAACSSFV